MANILNNIAKAAVGIGAGVSLFQASIYNVDGGFRAVMFDRLRGVQVTANQGGKGGGTRDQGSRLCARALRRASATARAPR